MTSTNQTPTEIVNDVVVEGANEVGIEGGEIGIEAGVDVANTGNEVGVDVAETGVEGVEAFDEVSDDCGETIVNENDEVDVNDVQREVPWDMDPDGVFATSGSEVAGEEEEDETSEEQETSEEFTDSDPNWNGHGYNRDTSSSDDNDDDNGDGDGDGEVSSCYEIPTGGKKRKAKNQD